MSGPTVCILTAGRGTRMGEGLAWLNKALAPLDDRAIISGLIESFGVGARYVIGLGHKSQQVRAYLAAAHPGVDFVFVDVDPWHGPGSGPGRSLLCCRDAIGEGSFYFAPCDAVLGGPVDLAIGGDWVGVASVAEEDSAGYCNFRLEQGRVVGIADKQRVGGDDHRAFTGLMRIERSAVFWDGLENGSPVAGEAQVSAGLRAMVGAGGLRAIEHVWIDVGEEEAYRAEIVRRHGFDFSKPGEAFYAVAGRVIKLFDDHDAAAKRVARGRANPRAFPEMLDSPPGTVVYGFVEGETLYSGVDVESLGALIGWCRRELWKPAAVGGEEFAAACDGFYRGKTLGRVESLRSMGGLGAEPATVNGERVPGVDDLLARIDWDSLSRGGEPVFFHGDLQFDNVLATPDGAFKLLDWRQDFGGGADAGDLDYDLAKMLGGIRMDYAAIKSGELGYEIVDGDARPRLPSCRNAAELEPALLAEAERMGRDRRRIELITALIHLNMAPLHGEPFCSALRDVARAELDSCLRSAGAPARGPARGHAA